MRDQRDIKQSTFSFRTHSRLPHRSRFQSFSRLLVRSLPARQRTSTNQTLFITWVALEWIEIYWFLGSDDRCIVSRLKHFNYLRKNSREWNSIEHKALAVMLERFTVVHNLIAQPQLLINLTRTWQTINCLTGCVSNWLIQQVVVKRINYLAESEMLKNIFCGFLDVAAIFKEAESWKLTEY